MSSKNRVCLSQCGRGERLIGSGRTAMPFKTRHRDNKAQNGTGINNDTDSSIVSLTSSTNSARDDGNKTKTEINRDLLKESNSMLSTDLYPTRDTEAEKVLLAELKNARTPREDQSTDDFAMKPIIVTESNFIAYSKGNKGRLKVRTKSRLKDDRAPRASRERLPNPPKPMKQSKIKSRGGASRQSRGSKSDPHALAGATVKNLPEASPVQRSGWNSTSCKRKHSPLAKSEGARSTDPKEVIEAKPILRSKQQCKKPTAKDIEASERRKEKVTQVPEQNSPSKGARSKDSPSKGALSKDPSSKDARYKDSPLKNAYAKDPPSKDYLSKGSPSKIARSNGPLSKREQSKGSRLKDTRSKGPPSKGASSKNPVSKSILSRDSPLNGVRSTASTRGAPDKKSQEYNVNRKPAASGSDLKKR
ncbi:pentapeptide MXKDX repeat family protein-like [Tropilaelaps mercedesae]|uniref:Pentapeptide MXKDX repeat family protein-like n=1 Tax=Tropilaelaps mercedesae TaxID=418985 RepID=A0A1V9XVP1_9ACAR|nr:pentapeptide MXKDX repeat family protein-like [Tropilaelaps mercedesae]